MLDWLRRESLATLAMFGTALTLLGQLATLIPFAPPLAALLALWNSMRSHSGALPWSCWACPCIAIWLPRSRPRCSWP